MTALTCPLCLNNSYSSDKESFNVCPYCGFMFSGIYGPERRSKERFVREICFDFPYKEQLFLSSTINLSQKGMAIQIFGTPSITEDEIFDFFIGDHHVKAKVIWLKKLSDKSIAGLQRLN